jgi:serine protease Do
MITNRTQRRVLPLRLFMWVAAVAAGVLLTSVAACGSTVKAAPQSGVKFASTVARASMVYVQVKWRGWVVVPRNVSVSSTEYIAKGTYGPFKAITSCSGFAASASGDIVTAGHCVDATSFYGGKGAVLTAMASEWKHANGTPLSPAQRDRQTQILLANASVEGYESGSPVDRTVTVTVPATSTGAIVQSESYPADVVDVQPFKQGDVALLRATGVVAPMLPVAQTTPATGDTVVAGGYPGDVAAQVDSTTPATFLEGTVSGTQTVNGTPFTQISSSVTAGMSGGPVLNIAGQVAGTVSWAPSGTTSANFMTDVGSIRSVLTSNGVSNRLTPAGRAFRQGLAYYFARRYHEAVQQFSRTLALEPGQAMATQYRQMAIARYPQDVNPPGNGRPWWIYLAAGVAVLILAGAAGMVLMRRRRARPAGEKPTQPVPGPAPSEPATQAAPVPTPTPPEPRVAIPEPAPSEPATQGQPVPEAARPGGPAGQETPTFCPNCGARHPKGAHYCERCGQPFPASFPVEHGGDEGIRR